MSVQQNLTEISARIEAAARRAGRDPGEVRLLAVSKLQPLELIEEAYSLGVRDFGENYVQELVEKRQKLSHLKDIRWHLIGHLQTNKAKLVVANASFFHALDSVKLAHELAKRARDFGRRDALSVFVQINVDQEESKSGVSPDDADRIIDAVQTEPALKFAGLMCIPEPKENPELMRPAFQKLRKLCPPGASLSMGMSEDFEVAIEEGANWVRVGRKLFGERKR